MRHLIVSVLMTGLLMLSPGAPQFVMAQAAHDASADARAVMNTLFAALESLQADIDRTRIEVEALSFEMAFEEAATIVAFVRDEIAFQQYPGLLRGAQGTLVSGAGNALDQAVLLAILLGDAGHDVRIASGRLSPEQAELLVRSMGPVDAGDAGAGRASAARFADLLGFDEGAVESVADSADDAFAEIRSEAAETARYLAATMREEGLFVAGDDIDRLVDEARTYYWVEYGFGGLGWQAAHVAFGDDVDVVVEAESYLDGEIPEELQHRFRFQVLIEQRLGGELVVKPVTAAWERPAANMFGLALSYVNLPDGIAADEADDIDAALDRTTFFIPVLQDTVAPGAQSFDLDGNSLAPEDAANPAAAVFQTVGGLFGGAAGMLAGEPDPDDFVGLTAQWIEYTLVAPGGEETLHRRTVFDRIGVANREAGRLELDPNVSAADAARALTTTHTFMVAPGHYSPDFILDRSVDATLAARPVLDAALAVTVDFDAPDPIVTGDYQLDSRAVDHLNVFAAFDAGPRAPDVLSYRAEPGLVVVERAAGGEQALVDVVNNRRRVFHTTPGGLPRLDHVHAIETGTWETRVEGLPISHPTARVGNVFRSMAAADAEGIPIVVLRPDAEQEIDGIHVPYETRVAILQDLRDGYVVLTPRAVPAEAELAAWWRIDPQTGETLGRGGDGRGMSLAEYTHQQAVSAALLKGGLILGGTRTLIGCGTKKTIQAYGCCVYEGVIVGGVMVGIGAIIAAYFAIPAIVLFVALDLTVGGGLMVGGMLNVLPSICTGIAMRCTPHLNV
ncbi:hypothetical protein BH23DEI1_BH23DEI1_12850 [soil metagenome]